MSITTSESALDAVVKAVTAAGLDDRDFGSELRERKEALEQAKAHLRRERARRPALPTPGTGAEIWPTLDARERNTLLRGLLGAVIVKRSGRGGRPSLDDRVRVISYGADLRVAMNNGGDPGGIVVLHRPRCLG